MKFYKKSFKYMILSFMSIFLGCSSASMIWENEDAMTQFKNTRQNYSVQLSSFVIPTGKSGTQTAEDELNRLTKIADTKGYNLKSHPLFSAKPKDSNWACCAVGSFKNEQDAQLLADYFNNNVFPKEKPVILKPNSKIVDSSLEFVVFRPKSS